MGYETLVAIMKRVKPHSHTYESRNQLVSSLENQKPTFSPRMRGKNWNFEGAIIGIKAQDHIMGLGLNLRVLNGPRRNK